MSDYHRIHYTKHSPENPQNNWHNFITRTYTMADFTSIYHRTSYPAISSSNALNTQTNRTILITGASAGIGRSIAKSFSNASASRVILLGRTQSTLLAAAAELPNAEARVCDISSTSQIQELWEWIRAEDIHVDVLVLNAALTVTGSLKTGAETIWGSFETTVLGNLRMAQEFVAQMGDRKGHVSVLKREDPVRCLADERSQALINISSFMAHSNPAPLQGAYSASKAAFANLLQHLAEEVPPEKATIINVHPGAIFTDAARTAGFTRDTLPFDDGQSL